MFPEKEIIMRRMTDMAALAADWVTESGGAITQEEVLALQGKDIKAFEALVERSGVDIDYVLGIIAIHSQDPDDLAVELEVSAGNYDLTV
jgi:hypothetical protein